MLRVGYRIRLSSGKGPDREGVVTALVGSMLRVRWPSQEETLVIPGPGTVTVLASSSGHAPSAVPSGQLAPTAAVPKKAVPKKAVPKKAVPKKAAPKKATPKKATPKKACRRRRRRRPRRRRPRRRRRWRGLRRRRPRRRSPRRRSARPRLSGRHPLRRRRRPRQVPGRRRARVAARRRRRGAPGSLISAARRAKPPTECCQRRGDRTTPSGRGVASRYRSPLLVSAFRRCPVCVFGIGPARPTDSRHTDRRVGSARASKQCRRLATATLARAGVPGHLLGALSPPFRTSRTRRIAWRWQHS